MATIDDKSFIDNIVDHNGFYNGDDESSPDNPRCIKIIEYTNMAGRIAWGTIFEGDNLNKYRESEYITNPKVYWEYKANEDTED